MSYWVIKIGLCVEDTASTTAKLEKLEEKACRVKETMALQVLVYVADDAVIT